MTRYARLDDLPAHLRDQVERDLRGGSPKPKKTPKYRNKKTQADGHTFDSQLEADYYQHLRQLWLAGIVRWFNRQVIFDLPGGISYRADFVVVFRKGVDKDVNAPDSGLSEVLVIDPKGVLTPEARLKLKLMEDHWKVTVLLAKRNGHRGWKLDPWRT